MRNGAERLFLLSQEVLDTDIAKSLPRKWQKVLNTLPLDTLWNEAFLRELMAEKFPTLADQKSKGLMEQMALAAYRCQSDIPIVALLVCDDAPQFRGLTRELALCWVHAGRHFNKLSRHLACHQERLTAFKTKFWKYYQELGDYRLNPSPEEAERLWKQFDVLFTANTGYEALDERIRLTASNKEALLSILRHPTTSRTTARRTRNSPDSSMNRGGKG